MCEDSGNPCQVLGQSLAYRRHPINASSSCPCSPPPVESTTADHPHWNLHPSSPLTFSWFFAFLFVFPGLVFYALKIFTRVFSSTLLFLDFLVVIHLLFLFGGKKVESLVCARHHGSCQIVRGQKNRQLYHSQNYTSTTDWNKVWKEKSGCCGHTPHKGELLLTGEWVSIVQVRYKGT